MTQSEIRCHLIGGQATDGKPGGKWPSDKKTGDLSIAGWVSFYWFTRFR
jgi:hypothetical protein